MVTIPNLVVGLEPEQGQQVTFVILSTWNLSTWFHP